MTVGGTFSGVGGFALAFERAGFRSAWEVEIDPDARDVLARHFPHSRIHADVRAVGRENLEPVSVVCGGFPCQDLSVAGKRAGLRGERSGLYWELLRVVAELQPRAVVFENVPGLLSSEGGRDMGAVLGGLADLGYGWAYRVLDAQFFGVPQRRRRVFVVGCAGGDWQRAAEILFEPESLRGDTAPRRKAGEVVAGTLTRGFGDRGASDPDRVTFVPTSLNGPNGADISHALCAVHTAAGRLDPHGETFVVGALSPGTHPGGFNGQDAYSGHLVASAVTASADHHGHSSPRGDGSDNLVPVNLNNRGHAGGEAADTLRADCHGANPMVAVGIGGSDVGYTLRANASHSGDKGDGGVNCTMVAHTLRANYRSNSNPASEAAMHVQEGMAVRRLTPTECERLQGFPPTERVLVIHVCHSPENRQTCAPAETLNPSGHATASSAGASGSRQRASHVDAHSPTRLPAQEKPVALSVRIDLERMAVEIRSPEKCLSSASDAGQPEQFPLHMPVGVFARLAALTTATADLTTGNGKAASQRGNGNSSRPSTGNNCVDVSGREIEELASDAGRLIGMVNQCFTSTTLQPTGTSPNCEQTLRTLCSYVVAAIGSFIPASTRNANSYAVELSVSCGWTATGASGKAMSDSVRYRQMGNAVAVPVVEWIARRLYASLEAAR